MQAPFDIAADLDTPVSAYLKLGALKPRFLLESVEGGERLARYSFLGFGAALEVRMNADALTIDGESRSRPENQQDYLDALRSALAIAPRPAPEVDGLPSGIVENVSSTPLMRSPYSAGNAPVINSAPPITPESTIVNMFVR